MQRLVGPFLGAGKKLANRELNDGKENGKKAIGLANNIFARSIAFCAFHSFLVEVQANAGHIHATHA